MPFGRARVSCDPCRGAPRLGLYEVRWSMQGLEPVWSASSAFAGKCSRPWESPRTENRVCQEQERNELEQEGWHGAIVMLLSENHSADQSAFLDLCVSPSASILLFFLLFLLFSTHSHFYSNFFQNQIGRSYSCSQKLPSLTLLDLSLLDLCSSVQSK